MVDANTIKKTKKALEPLIKRPKLTDKLLEKPPFRFLHDIISEVTKSTEFLTGLYEGDELNAGSISDRDAKVAYLQKAIDTVSIASKAKLSVRPQKIVSGGEPEKTNEFLQLLGQCAASGRNDAAVEKALKMASKPGKEKKEGGDAKEGKRKPKDEKDGDKKDAKGGEKGKEKKEGGDAKEGKRKPKDDKGGEKKDVKGGEKKDAKDGEKKGGKGGEKRQEKGDEKKGAKDDERKKPRQDKDGLGGEKKGAKDDERRKSRQDKDGLGGEKKGAKDDERRKSRQEKDGLGGEKKDGKGGKKEDAKGGEKDDAKSGKKKDGKIGEKKDEKAGEKRGGEDDEKRKSRLEKDSKKGDGKEKSEKRDASKEKSEKRDASKEKSEKRDASKERKEGKKHKDDKSKSDRPKSDKPPKSDKVESEKKKDDGKKEKRRKDDDDEHRVKEKSERKSKGGEDAERSGRRDGSRRDDASKRDVSEEASSRRKRRKEREEAPEGVALAQPEPVMEADTSQRMQRPASAKGSRRRVPQEKDETGPSRKRTAEEDDAPNNLPIAAGQRRERPKSSHRQRNQDVEAEDGYEINDDAAPRVTLITGDHGDDEEDDMYVEAAAPIVAGPTGKSSDGDDVVHGVLVQKIMESQKQYVDKDDKKDDHLTNLSRQKERSIVQKEINSLRTSIQSLASSAAPIGKILDYLQEDLDSMQKELSTWKTENRANDTAIKSEESNMHRSLEPLREQLSEMDALIDREINKISAMKCTISQNDLQIQQMLSTMSFS